LHFIIPRNCRISPTPFAEKHPQTITDLPQNSTVGRRHSDRHSSPLLHLTYTLRLLLSQSVNLLSSIHKTLPQAVDLKWAWSLAYSKCAFRWRSESQGFRLATRRCKPFSANLREIVLALTRIPLTQASLFVSSRKFAVLFREAFFFMSKSSRQVVIRGRPGRSRSAIE